MGPALQTEALSCEQTVPGTQHDPAIVARTCMLVCCTQPRNLLERGKELLGRLAAEGSVALAQQPKHRASKLIATNAAVSAVISEQRP